MTKQSGAYANELLPALCTTNQKESASYVNNEATTVEGYTCKGCFRCFTLVSESCFRCHESLCSEKPRKILWCDGCELFICSKKSKNHKLKECKGDRRKRCNSCFLPKTSPDGFSDSLLTSHQCPITKGGRVKHNEAIGICNFLRHKGNLKEISFAVEEGQFGCFRTFSITGSETRSCETLHCDYLPSSMSKNIPYKLMKYHKRNKKKKDPVVEDILSRNTSCSVLLRFAQLLMVLAHDSFVIFFSEVNAMVSFYISFVAK